MVPRVRIVRTGTSVLFAAALLASSVWRIGPLPALGPWLEPWRGIWGVVRTARLPERAVAAVPDLREPVEIRYDGRGVPHIFAATEEDAMRALGYVVARDRLFQLELQTRAAAGTLTELVGPGALAADREQRHLSLAASAEAEWASLPPDSRTARLLVAYAEGVNAHRRSIARGPFPLEYYLLGAAPAPWQPVHSLYLIRRMGYTLTYDTGELRRGRLDSLLGRAVADALVPIHAPIQEPIQPGPRARYPWFDTSAVPYPAEWGSLGAAANLPSEDAYWAGGSARSPHSSELGSNNWAVGPARSTTGHALLAGDPHLDLTLPSIWYEVHLVVSDVLDVYGVTIPGWPGVVIGFNRDVAWTFTNVGADVLDYYEEEVDDLRAPRRYRVDGEWRPLAVREERYRDPRGRLIAVDTVYATHRGPLVFRTGARPVSMRWTNVEDHQAVDALFQAGQARSAEEFMAFTAPFGAAAQNMLVADRRGTIAIRSTGRFPLRPGDGRGDRIRDGTRSANDWIGFWPVSRYPSSVNPVQGFLASANQEPVDPAADPAYLGVNWPSPWRAMRINRLLRENSTVSPEDMRRMQMDPGSERAELFVPLFLAAGRSARAAGTSSALLDTAVEYLAAWPRTYRPGDRHAVLFEVAMQELADRVWDELILPEGGRRVATPAEQVLWRVVRRAVDPWCDDRRTVRIEHCADVLNASLETAFEQLRARRGRPGSDGWRWDRFQRANIWHLLRLPALSALDLPVPGGPGTINPSSGTGTHGASWRMIVQLGPEVEAATLYPGGQSGHPLSLWYRDRVDRWLAGELERALVPRAPAELDGTVSRLVLVPEEDR